MLQRCYSDNSLSIKPTYKTCIVCDDWLCYETFEKWFDEKYYNLYDEEMGLDKDIIHKNNNIYSPDNCVFVPQSINKLFTKRQNDRGDYPIGVCYYKASNCFRAQCCDGKGKIVGLGYFITPEEAFVAYKTYKEIQIKNIANTYKDFIPTKLYDAMLSYVVEITD